MNSSKYNQVVWFNTPNTKRSLVPLKEEYTIKSKELNTNKIIIKAHLILAISRFEEASPSFQRTTLRESEDTTSDDAG